MDVIMRHGQKRQSITPNNREMNVIEITRPARCKDCAYLVRGWHGKLCRHFCDNLMSPQYLEMRRLKDLVCEKWAITKTE
jgi:hypothetical protein